MALSASRVGHTGTQSHAALSQWINEVVVGWWHQRLQTCGYEVSVGWWMWLVKIHMPGLLLLYAQIKLQDVQHCLFICTYTCQQSSVHLYMLMLLLMHGIAHFHHHTPPLPSTHSRTHSSIDSCHLIKVRTYASRRGGSTYWSFSTRLLQMGRGYA